MNPRAPRAGFGSAAAAVLGAALLAGAAGCSSGGSAEQAQPPTAHLVRTGPGQVESVVLTRLGAARIAVRTTTATPAAKGTDVTIPAGALLYEPNGDPAVYVNTGPLTYTRYIVPVDFISNNTVYLKGGRLAAGAAVVTQGAEELLGVQNGVGEET